MNKERNNSKFQASSEEELHIGEGNETITVDKC